MKTKLEKHFGVHLCNDEVLKKYMPAKYFAKYIKTKRMGEALDAKVAQVIAKAIKRWSMLNGATHYCHWFLPLNGKTAEKQVAFIEIDTKGCISEDFDERSLIKGETDASSFPNGGERMTFEARGYTVWDYTSPVFIKEDADGNKVLCIPTAFCSYNGTALDEKTPLLRAMETLNHQSLRVLKHLGYNNVKKVTANVGAEQEYFLIRKEEYEKRLDLKMTGRTLFGEAPTKSQESHSHYYGVIDDHISKFMNEVDKKLWEMGVTAKLQHNEVAPSQHELVPIFATSNIATDQNQIIMETVSKVAKKHGLIALFHEKPFNHVNGSGKHVNWSVSTDTGLNLFDSTMDDKTVFLTFFSTMIATIDEYYKLIRSSTAYRSNDLRLGGDEAPPALISVFIGEYLEKLLFSEKTEDQKDAERFLDTRVKTLPKTIKDYCDRNRTSPFAFCGSKFEFRMVGSSQSIAWPITCLCTTFAKTLCDIADKLDKTSGNKREAVLSIVKDNAQKHKRIIFNGNGYDEAWKKEAKKRGLEEQRDCISCYNVFDEKAIKELFVSMGVLEENELSLRKNALLKNYIENVDIEAKTTCQMLGKYVYPSLLETLNFFKSSTSDKKGKQKDYARDCIEKISDAYNQIFALHQKLEIAIKKQNAKKTEQAKAVCVRDGILPLLDQIRSRFDAIECLIPESKKPFPSYNDVLFNY